MKKEKHSNCKCEFCQSGIEAFKAREAKLLKQVGHVIRYVMDEYDIQGHSFPSIYTYGLMQTYNHYEIECVLPIDQEAALFLMNTLALKVKEGIRFEFDQMYQFPELNNVPFYFLPNIQLGSEMPVLRLVLADPNNFFPEDEDCEAIYAVQPIIGIEKVSHLIEQYWMKEVETD